MGPRCDLVLRRHRDAPPDVRREALTQVKPPKKKKNVRTDEIDGKARGMTLAARSPFPVSDISPALPSPVKPAPLPLTVHERWTTLD